jgi:hypothetical protein
VRARCAGVNGGKRGGVNGGDAPLRRHHSSMKHSNLSGTAMNKLLAMLVAGAFVATSTIALAQTPAAPATPATPATPPAASSGSMKADSMDHGSMTKKSSKKAKKAAKKKAAVAKEDQMIKNSTHSSNSAVKAAPATGGAAMSNTTGMKADTKGK